MLRSSVRSVLLKSSMLQYTAHHVVDTVSGLLDDSNFAIPYHYSNRVFVIVSQ